jgi:uncharacterized membrane protein
LGGDYEERRLTGTFILTISSTLITWSSKKQTCIAMSSTESEYQALVEVTKEIIWIGGLYKGLGFDKQIPVKVYCNNQSVIKISKNPIFYFKTKRFEMYLHFVRDMVKKKKIEILYTNGHATCQHYDKGTWKTEIH